MGSAGEDTVQDPRTDNGMKGRGGKKSRHMERQTKSKSKKTREAVAAGVSEEQTEGEGGKEGQRES